MIYHNFWKLNDKQIALYGKMVFGYHHRRLQHDPDLQHHGTKTMRGETMERPDTVYTYEINIVNILNGYFREQP